MLIGSAVERLCGWWIALSIASPVSPSAAPSACADFHQPEPDVADPAHDEWLHARGEAARACGDHRAAADAFEQLMHAARERGRVEVHGAAVLGLARALLEIELDSGRVARLERARSLLDALLAEERTASGHLPDTMAFARGLRDKVNEALDAVPVPIVDPPIVQDDPTDSIDPTDPSARVEPDTPVPQPRAAADGDAVPGAPQHRRAAIAGAVGGSALVVAGLSCAAVAIGMRPWYGQRYRDAPGYTIEVARDLTRPWVVGYGIASATATIAGTILVAVFATRLDKRAQRRQSSTARSRRHDF